MNKELKKALQTMKMNEIKNRMEAVLDGLKENKILCFACLVDCTKDFYLIELEKGKKASLCKACYEDFKRIEKIQ